MRARAAWSRKVVLAIGAAILSGCAPRYPQPGKPIATADTTATLATTAIEAPRAAARRELVTNSSGSSALAGVQAGDFILAVNGMSVATTGDVQAALARSGKVVALLIERDQQQLFVPVPLTGAQAAQAAR